MRLCNRDSMLILLGVFFVLGSCKKDFENKTGNADATMSTDAVTGKKPNIILIVGDDVGREIPTYNGGESYSTPNLDNMAANGIQFPYFFSHPDGPPSRLALVTGKYNYRNWVQFGYLAPTEKTFANMLQDNGYTTCYTGKWQFDGGDTSIRSHGFDKYLVFMPFNPDNNNGHDQFYHRYKNPYLYENARYLTDAEVAGKYSEDMYFDYVSNFIDSNKSNPMLIVYSCNLVQKPWVPTPDDPEFATWNPDNDNILADRKYFPSMVSYMDKIIGKIVAKVQDAGLANNTLILFTSDNATHKSISSMYKGQLINGSKDSTDFTGINVPFLAYAYGRIGRGVVDTSLVDMTDFFPTFADLAHVRNTTTYQPLDGTTFYDNLLGKHNNDRTTVYCYWPRSYAKAPDISYVLDYTYKLYDSAGGNNFYNYREDMYEQHPLSNTQLSDSELLIKKQFKRILNQSK